MVFTPVVRCVVGCLVVASAASEGQTIVNLGVLPGGTTATPRGLSVDGSTVVGIADIAVTGGSTYHPFRWRAATGMVGLGTLRPLTPISFAQATAVSGDGTIVVGYSDATIGGTRGFRWTAATGLIDLGSLLPNRGSYAEAISADGMVVGGYAGTTVGNHGFRWTLGGGMIDTTPISPAMITSVQGANADGSVLVGTMSTVAGFQSARFVGGSVTSLGAIALNQYSNAAAVSADGSVVAGFADNSNHQARATRWTAGTGTVSLGTLPGGFTSQALCISPDGVVLAGLSDSATTQYRGFLWTSATGMVEIQSYLTSRGVNLNGWELTSVRGVLNGATTMTGTGVLAGQPLGWYITGLAPIAIACPGDLASTGGIPPGDGVRDNNDFVVFINFFFTLDPRADLGSTGGVPGSDGAFDNNDFVVFVNFFFSPCA